MEWLEEASRTQLISLLPLLHERDDSKRGEDRLGSPILLQARTPSARRESEDYAVGQG